MQLRLISPSSPDTRDSQQSVANFSGSQNLVQTVSEGITEYFRNESNSFSSDTRRLIAIGVTPSSGDELIINNEIDIEDWKNSLDYTDETINKLIEEFLDDYDIEVKPNNIQWFKEVVNSIIENYEKEYSVFLNPETRIMLRNLITKMSYDKLCVKKSFN